MWMGENPALVEFLQRAVGYSLTGLVTEQVWLFLHGTGANGKSTFLNIILKMLGDYAAQAPHDLLIKAHGKRDKEEMAGLFGRRFVPTVEIPEGARLAETLAKVLTGGDQVVGRILYKGEFTFSPTWKIWLAGNRKPQIQSRDEATWRRIRLVPFNVRIPKDERDKNLPIELEKELPGILNWAIAGCLEWQKRGDLDPPTEVLAAVYEYKNETDLLADFLSHYESVADSDIPCSDVYNDYKLWVEDESDLPPIM